MANEPTPRLLDEQLWFALYSASKKFTHFYQDALAEFKLTYPQYITMLILWEKSPMTVRDLGKRLNLDSGTLTPLLKRLEKLGWVNRNRNQEDERQVDITLTDYALEQRDAVYSRVNNCIDLIGMKQSEYDAMNDQLERLQTELDRVKNNHLIQNH